MHAVSVSARAATIRTRSAAGWESRACCCHQTSRGGSDIPSSGWRRYTARSPAPPDDEQRAALFSAGELAQIEEALLTPDGQSGVFRFKAGARVQGEALNEAHVVIEGGKVRAMCKQRCQWLFSRGTLLRYGT